MEPPRYLVSFLSALALVAQCVQGAPAQNITSTSEACYSLARAFPGQVYQEGTALYHAQNTNFWSNTTVLSPSCVFQPSNAEDVGRGVALLRACDAQFAVRAVGHMPNPGFNSINNGVLLSLSNLTALQVAPDHKSVQFGPAFNSGEVYEYLGKFGLVALLARYGPVGTSGMVLGGGISHFSGEHGWAANNVLEYELVAANGAILHVNKRSYPDLFWAMKGGANNFGIVTKYTIATYKIPKLYAGIASWSESNITRMTDAVKSFVSPGGGIEDPKAAISPAWYIFPNTGAFNGSTIMVHSGGDAAPASLANFTRTADSNTAHVRTYSNFMPETAPAADAKVRDSFHSVALKATPEAVQMFLDVVTPQAQEILKDVPNAYVGLAPQPVSLDWMNAARDAGGDPMSLDPARGTFMFCLIALEWTDAASDAIIASFARNMTKQVEAEAVRRGLHYPFVYLNDAGPDQDPFQYYGYGASLPVMERIRRKYDPHGVFQKLLPGGFKLNGRNVDTLSQHA